MLNTIDPSVAALPPLDAPAKPMGLLRQPSSEALVIPPTQKFPPHSPTKTTAPDWCYQSLKKQAWRFAKIAEYIFIHAAVFAGTTFAYSVTCAGFIAYLENSEEMDMDTFEITFWLSLIVTMLAGIRDTLKYASFFCQCMRANDTDFNALLKEKYKKLWTAINKPNAVIAAMLNGMSFGSTVAHISALEWDIDPMMLRGVTVGAGTVASVLSFIQKTHNNDATRAFSQLKTLGVSAGVSIITITNYVFGVLTNLRRNKSRMHPADIDTVYTYLALFSLLAIFYYTRLEYEMDIADRRRHGHVDTSKIQELERSLKECIGRCNKKTAAILSSAASLINHSGMAIVSASLLYSMWSSWRSAAVAFNIVAQDDLTMYPNTTFDLEILLLLGIGNLTVRFVRLYHVTNKKLTNDLTFLSEKTPLLQAIN